MKAEIIKKEIEFIKCGKCDYQLSFLLRKDMKNMEFQWNCPHCFFNWHGVADKEGEITVSPGESTGSRYVLIRLPNEWTPEVVRATRLETTDERKLRKIGDPNKSYKTFRDFFMEQTGHDEENNPQGYVQYAAIEVKT